MAGGTAMAGSEFDRLERELTAALNGYDWTRCDAISEQIVERIQSDPVVMMEAQARRIMQKLRRKRRFASMALIAESLIQSGLQTAQVRRQYGQALIDQGMLTAAVSVLKELMADPTTNATEQAEARGLTGRIYKQLYVNEAGKAQPARAKANLQRAFDSYLSVFNLDTQQVWHGINVVALLARAMRFLGQPVPEEAAGLSLHDFWTWARAHWSMAAVPRCRALVG